MLAIQFQTNQETVVRDTRDMWELRADLKAEQELQSKISNEILNVDEVLQKYDQNQVWSQEAALKEQKESLKEKIGLTEKTGEGVILTIEPLFSESIYGQSYETPSPQLLTRLINELNMYQAEAIAIADQRIISTTPIRDVNGKTYVNVKPIPPLPLTIKVIAKNAEKLHNHLEVSQAKDDFAIENLSLSSVISSDIVLPAYDGTLRIQYMEPVKNEKEKS
ncbi:hypothetical protein BFG57_06030 [Bacillus solimangrovi]|uniref:NgoFVII family restriction endonuclease n=2 Tax=Bacillus solimangrovi TaxID=1305675 RepID=A0A1E5LB23_9BACI|nr:hypothetical protein BFG57_06030 [Bacillus solimangrovi]